MTEPQNTPELRFPEFKNEWKIEKLGDLANIVRGASPRPIKDSKWFDDNSDVGWLRISDVTQQNGKIKFLQQHLSTEGQKKTRVLYKPHLLLSIAASVGKPVINYVKTGVHDGFLIFMNPKFNLYFMFNWLEYFQLKWNKYGQPGSQVNLNSDLVKSQSIYIPDSYEEEKKIGEFFSKLDRQIELEEQKLAKLEEQKKGYMQKIFSQELRFKDEKGNEYPEWEEKKLGDILERGNKDKVNEIGKYRRLTISLHGKGLYEVKQERKTKDTRPFYQRFEGELIIGKQNFFNGSIAIVTREFNGFICSNAIMSYKISNHMNRKYLLEYLLQNDFLRKNEYLADGTGQKELSEKKFEELEIKLPNSINEQQKIGVFLERLDNLIEKQSNKLELLKQRKKSFLQKMFV